MRDTEKRGPATTPNPAHATQASVATPADRRPGEWPTAAALRAKWAREHARRTWAYGAIKEHLADQPSPTAIRHVARMWCRDVLAAADELVKARNQEHAE